MPITKCASVAIRAERKIVERKNRRQRRPTDQAGTVSAVGRVARLVWLAHNRARPAHRCCRRNFLAGCAPGPPTRNLLGRRHHPGGDESSLGAALKISANRLLGTAIGAAMAALFAIYFPPRLVWYGVGIFLLGLVCSVTRASRAAYPLGGVAFTIVLLISHTEPPWHVAFHRFSEVSIGIVVAVVLTVVWPETEPALSEKK